MHVTSGLLASSGLNGGGLQSHTPPFLVPSVLMIATATAETEGPARPWHETLNLRSVAAHAVQSPTQIEPRRCQGVTSPPEAEAYYFVVKREAQTVEAHDSGFGGRPEVPVGSLNRPGRCSQGRSSTVSCRYSRWAARIERVHATGQAINAVKILPKKVRRRARAIIESTPASINPTACHRRIGSKSPVGTSAPSQINTTSCPHGDADAPADNWFEPTSPRPRAALEPRRRPLNSTAGARAHTLLTCVSRVDGETAVQTTMTPRHQGAPRDERRRSVVSWCLGDLVVLRIPLRAGRASHSRRSRRMSLGSGLALQHVGKKLWEELLYWVWERPM